MSTIRSQMNRHWPLGLLLVLSTIFLVGVTGHLASGIFWFSGHLLLFSGVFQFRQLSSLEKPTWVTAIYCLLVTSTPVLLALLIRLGASPEIGWQGFRHLDHHPWTTWLSFLILWSPVIGLWVWSTAILQLVQQLLPKRGERLTYLLLAALLSSSLALFDFLPVSFLPLLLSSVVFVLMLDLYLESSRTSLTWLLSWLFLLSLYLGAMGFQRSLNLDQQVHQAIAEEILTQGQPDTTRGYHFTFQWDILQSDEDKSLLPAVAFELAPGQSTYYLSAQRMDRVYRSPDGQTFVLVGRETGGYRPPLLLISLLFLSGLLYTFLLRGTFWAFGMRTAEVRLPLYGPPSLRIRIQLYFFGIALIAFLLVSWFTYGFFRDQTSLIQNWFESLLALNAFLLIVAGALSIFLANSITEPIVRIGQKLGVTQLQHNEPLSWPRQDEIGRLVRSYNQMILALDESAQQLARSERESAWREMAKQVAHEIKNPLTPMKLQLQQLLRLQKEDPERAAEWGQRVNQTLIEQIDGLARIATEFSHFARLPEAKPAAMDANVLLQSIHDLFRHNAEKVSFTIQLAEQAAPIYADQDQLTRVLNNLVRNALQAIPEDRAGMIHLRSQVNGRHIILEVQDNGSGIPEDTAERIFQPRFTTKNSGMGLGLAMSKSMVEQAGGTLTFSSEVGVGTTFRVELPKV